MSDDVEANSTEDVANPLIDRAKRLAGIVQHLRARASPGADGTETRRIADLLDEMESRERVAGSHLRLR